MNVSKVYWYEIRMIIGSDILQKYLFKSDHLYEVGDIIKKRYDSGAVAKFIIVYPYGTSYPEHILNLMSAKTVWSPILSEI